MDTKLWLYPSLVLGTMRQYAQASWEVLLLESFQIEIKYCIAKWNSFKRSFEIFLYYMTLSNFQKMLNVLLMLSSQRIADEMSILR